MYFHGALSLSHSFHSLHLKYNSASTSHPELWLATFGCREIPHPEDMVPLEAWD